MKTKLIQTAPERWTCRPQIGGERKRHVIQAATRREAAAKAAAIVAETKRNRENPTVEEILEIYKTLAGANLAGATLKPATAQKNANSLLLIMRRAGLDETTRLTALTPEIIDTWRRDAYKRAELDFNRPNPQKNSSLNATWRQARSVFCARAIAEYDRRGIRLPKSLDEFCRTPDLAPTIKREFTPLDAKTDARIRELAAAALDDKTGGNIPPKEVAAMVEMARYAGMTLREIMYFRPEWVIETPQGTFINIREYGDFTTKRGTKNRQIPVRKERLAKWINALNEIGTFGDPESPNTSQPYKCACLWLSRFMPNRTKKLHELRKMACSDMLSRTGDIFLASKFIGNSVSTTVKYYAGLINTIQPL